MNQDIWIANLTCETLIKGFSLLKWMTRVFKLPKFVFTLFRRIVPVIGRAWCSQTLLYLYYLLLKILVLILVHTADCGITDHWHLFKSDLRQVHLLKLCCTNGGIICLGGLFMLTREKFGFASQKILVSDYHSAIQKWVCLSLVSISHSHNQSKYRIKRFKIDFKLLLMKIGFKRQK